MFVLLLKTEHGWTDYLGSGGNEWPSEKDAWNAARELEKVGFCIDGNYEWDVIHAEDLNRYSLIS